MKDKELIELIKYTSFEMLMPKKISDEDAESILKEYKEAINYNRCCTELPTKEAELSELEKLVEQQSNSDIKLFKKDGYLGGFCDGFRLYSNWLRNK